MNAALQFRGTELIIRKDLIVSVYRTEIEVPATDVDNVITLPSTIGVTAVYCGATGTFHVSDTVAEIYFML